MSNRENPGNSQQQGEMVLVVPDKSLRGILSEKDHFTKGNLDLLDSIKSEMLFIDRESAERDTKFRQLIPYVVIRRKSDQDSYFLFKRLNTQGEKRLHNLYSLGAGGHINPVDDSSENPLDAGLKRELEEELVLPDKYEIAFHGWIYSDIDPVSCVHAGMVYIMDVIRGEIEIREKDKMTGEWLNLNQIKNLTDSMEGWSRIVLDYLIH